MKKTNKIIEQSYFKTLCPIKKQIIWRTWVVLLVEAIGTFILVFGILAISALSFENSAHHSSNESFWKGIESIFTWFIVVALYVGILIYILLLLFRNVSANFNPVVTVIEIYTKKDTPKLGAYKITVQMTFALAAAFFIYGVSNWTGIWDSQSSADLEHTLGAVYPYFKSWNWSDLSGGHYAVTFTDYTIESFLYWVAIILIETIFIFIALTQIFWVKLSKNLHSIWVALVFVILITVGLRFSTVSLNPARMFAPAIVTEILGGNNTLQFAWIYFAGQAFGVAIFIQLDKIKRANDKPKKRISLFATTRDKAAKKIVREKTTVDSSKKNYQVVVNSNFYNKKYSIY